MTPRQIRLRPRRLDKLLADCGVGSRSHVDDVLASGRVSVDGATFRWGYALVDPAAETVRVDSEPVALVRQRRYLLFHKPAGVITAMSDPHGRPTVAGCLPEALRPVVAPVGRLDKATTGALMFTDDGDLAYLLLHPDHHVAKRYRLTLRLGSAVRHPDLLQGRGLEDDDPRLQMLRDGVLVDGRRTRPAEVSVDRPTLRQDGPDALIDLLVTITEGRNRQVRKMARAARLRLHHLHREAVGAVSLDATEVGHTRALTEEEIDALYADAGGRDLPARRAASALADKLHGGALDAREAAIARRYLGALDDAPG